MKSIICIKCPKGCKIQLHSKGEELEISGYGCQKGYNFGLEEFKDPKRTFATTIATAFSEVPVLPVRLTKPISKKRIFDVMDILNSFKIDYPVRRGDIIFENILGLGSDVIVESDILIERKYHES